MSQRWRRIRRSARAFFLIARLAFRVDPLRSVLVLGLSLVSSLFAPVLAVGLQFMINGAVTHRAGLIDIAAVVLAVMLGLLVAAVIPQFVVSLTLGDRTAHQLDRRMVELTTNLSGLEHFERSEFADKLATMRNQRALLVAPIEPIVGAFSLFFTVVFTTAILFRVHPLLLLVSFAGLPMVVGGSFAERIRQRWVEKSAEMTRVANHLFQLATTGPPGKELRIFGLGPELLRRHQRILDDLNRERTRVWFKTTSISMSGAVLAGAATFAGNLFVVYRAVHGVNSPGDVALVMTISGQAFFTLIGLFGLAIHLTQIAKAAERYLWFEEYATERLAAQKAGGSLPAPDRIERGIEFRNVTFRYPGVETTAIADVDLFIHAGATVALVGENGAGKTTLVKLLSRFYEPTSGQILVDDERLDGYDIAGWRARISAAYQDYMRFELVAAEAVGVGDVARIDDRAAVRDALVLARAEELEEDLPLGLETQLGRSFPDGAELSMGQWQKLALGRAMMRPEPLLLILDEPTASLDAQTEHALFERYASAAKRTAAGRGGITILVSHRFSTVRMADMIVVVDKGRVVEHGSHSELMQKNGLYAELYEVQAKAYR